MKGRVARALDWSGRAGRGEFWLIALICLAAAFGGGMIVEAADPGSAVVPGVFLVFAALLVFGISGLVRRLHDTGRSGGWAWLAPVPFVSLAVVLFCLLAPPRVRAPYTWPAGATRRIGQTAVVFLALLLASRAFWSPWVIMSSAAEPALLAGDYLVAGDIRPDEVRRGDLLVFRRPAVGAPFVSRLIGLPGDRLAMKDGTVWLNGAPLPQAKAGTYEQIKEAQGPGGAIPRCANDPVGLGALCTSERLTETLPDGRRYDVLNIAEGMLDDAAEVTVPEGHLFFLGDNRDNAIDSRIPVTAGGFGMVPAADVIGRASRVVFSAAGVSLADVTSWRQDRFLKAVE